jgi:hypothetical protein
MRISFGTLHPITVQPAIHLLSGPKSSINSEAIGEHAAMSIPKSRELQAAEDHWRNETQIAAERYWVAVVATRKAQQISSNAPNADGGFAYTQAFKNKNAALAEYRRVLEIFSNLALHGKLPAAW